MAAVYIIILYSSASNTDFIIGDVLICIKSVCVRVYDETFEIFASFIVRFDVLDG